MKPFLKKLLDISLKDRFLSSLLIKPTCGCSTSSQCQFLDIHTTIESGFILKRVCDMA